MKRVFGATALLALALFAGRTFAAEVDKSPVRQFTRTEPTMIAATAQPAPDMRATNPDLSRAYYKVQNYRASYLAGTVRLLLSADGIIQANDDLNLIIILDTDENIDIIQDMLEEVDRLPEQIIINASVLEVNNTKSSENGINVSTVFENSAFREGINNDKSTQYTAVLGTGATTRINNQNIASLDATMTYSPMSKLIKFLVTKNLAKVVAEPKIVTVNNKTGKVFIGDRVKLSGYTYSKYDSSAPATEPVAAVEEEAGILLEVTPHIGESDFITLNIKTGFGNVSSVSSGMVKSNVKEAQSTVIVKSGEPVVIGGYKTQEYDSTTYKFPILGDIPVLKKIFSRKDKTAQEIELVVILTPTLVKPGEGLPNTIPDDSN